MGGEVEKGLKERRIRGASIGVRTALLAWLVTLISVLLFVVLIVPHEKQYFLDALKSKAGLVDTAVRDVAAAALVAQDFSELIEYCGEILNNSEELKYVVVTGRDGCSVLLQRNHWKSLQLEGPWQEGFFQDKEGFGIAQMDFSEEKCFHYSRPLRYAGVSWGMLHIGLSLDKYHAGVTSVYQRTAKVAVLCLFVGLLAAVIYAGRLVRPLQKLEQVVHRVANGDLSAVAEIHSGDEVENLAHSFNEMTDALRQRDLVLQAVRFAAEGFMKASHWERVLPEMMARLGETSRVSRIHLFQRFDREEGRIELVRRNVWRAAGVAAASPDFARFFCDDVGYEWIEGIHSEKVVQHVVKELDPAARALLERQDTQSIILVPVLVDKACWGFFCLEDCVSERVWSTVVIDSFWAGAEIFGAAVQREQIQQQMEAAREAAEAANRTKSLFLATMSHEIRTPMNGIIGTASLLDDTPLNDEQAEYVQLIQSSGNALLELLNDILDFSKIEAGKLSLVDYPFNLHETCERISELFMPITQAKGVELMLRFSPCVPPQVIGDYGRIRQILMNLVSNAVKFTAQGHVYISVDTVELDGEQATLEFRVEDTGIGIPKAKQDRLFKKFSQADASNTREFGGTGLGLAISKELVTLMRGEIGVESVAGEGACFGFRITLPIVASEKMDWLVEPHYRGERVLILDRNRLQGTIIAERLKFWGLECSVCDSLDQIYAIAQQEHISVVIADEASFAQPEFDAFHGGDLLETGLLVLCAPNQKKNVAREQRILKPMRLASLYKKVSLILGYAEDPDLATSSSSPVAEFVAQGEGMTVLVVEDNSVNQIIARRMLARHGCTVEIVENGELALFAVRGEKRFDLIFMDCQMPCMDGYQATRAIREYEKSLEEARYTPIIAMTANAMQDEYNKCVEAGMDGYLPKPIKKEQIDTMLSRYAAPKIV